MPVQQIYKRSASAPIGDDHKIHLIATPIAPVVRAATSGRRARSCVPRRPLRCNPWLLTPSWMRIRQDDRGFLRFLSSYEAAGTGPSSPSRSNTCSLPGRQRAGSMLPAWRTPGARAPKNNRRLLQAADDLNCGLQVAQRGPGFLRRQGEVSPTLGCIYVYLKAVVAFPDLDGRKRAKLRWTPGGFSARAACRFNRAASFSAFSGFSLFSMVAPLVRCASCDFGS